MTIRAERSRSDIRRHPVAITAVVGVAGWLVLAMLAVGLGALVTHLVVGHTLGRGDLDAARWFAARRTGTWSSLSLVGSYFAETVTVLVVLAVALAALAVRRAWPQWGLLVVTMTVEAGVYLTATYFVSRDRPAVPRLEHLIVSDSFPSGHSAAAMAMYGSLCIVAWSMTRTRAWRLLFLALAIVAPIIVATSRVYRGMHNVTDVISGLLIGAGCIIVGYVAVRAGLAAASRRTATRAEVEATAAEPPSPKLTQEVAW